MNAPFPKTGLATAVHRVSLRPYQADIKRKIYEAWSIGIENVCAVLPTGAGKTVTFSDIVHEHMGASVVIAHRQELVSQISLALARDGVKHRIVGPKNVIKLCVNQHMSELGRSYYDANAQCGVAGVDTLIRRKDALASWLNRVTLWVMDECHHVLKRNKWGAAIEMFPNAKGLGVTATPMRADGFGLGRDADGVFDTLIVGPGMRDLINMGFLTEYRLFAPTTADLHLETVDISKTTHDYNPNQLKKAIRKSSIIGDVVSHYLRIAPGKLGVTFATDVETATDIAAKFNAAGVPAAVVSAKTPDDERARILRRFKNRELLQLVNVDLFGEGFDLPAIEVVSMARPTQSYGLYVQQFGRALRLMDGKEFAIIIDHVGNLHHGLPDAPRPWSLERREKRSSRKNNGIPLKACPECTAAYESYHTECPYCGHKPEPARRDGPEFVDGDLTELDAATLAQMRGEVAKIDMTTDEYRIELQRKGCFGYAVMGHVKKHAEKQEMQEALRASIAWWAGYQQSHGRTDAESYRLFYHTFGVDVLTAQALKRADALKLAEKINNKLGEF
jgi:superfamily II DNA or RNA helicase